MAEVDVFLTNKCNSNCIMCPLSITERKKPDTISIDELYEQIDCIDDGSFINITGGEPTYNIEKFIDVVSRFKERCQHANFQLLTNGRSFSDKRLVKKLIEAGPSNIRFTIPLHSSDPKVHDAITQSPNSFIQTDKGIKNLVSENQKVEIRVVLSQANINSIPALGEYVLREYPGIISVTFIGMEMMGNAAVNKESLWIDYDKAFKKIKETINLIIKSGTNVLLYNFPLCCVDKGYWHIAARSITEYKIRFPEECSGCSVKEICGGFFFSTMNLMKPNVYPVKD